MSKMHVVIVGGGVAGVEAALALHDLAGDRVRLTLVSDRPEFTLKALGTTVPFSRGHVLRRSLVELAQEVGAEFRQDSLVRVFADEHEIELASGERLAYDALVLGIGAVGRAALPHTSTFGLEGVWTTLNGILADVEEGYSRSVAFLVPSGATWTLPAYELALMTAVDVWGMGMDDVEITVVAPEASPVALLGETASKAVSGLLERAKVRFIGGVQPSVPRSQTVQLGEGLETLHADRLVALPVLEGPRVRGLRFDEGGFLPIDDHGSVAGVDDVYAAGDGADFPIKQGGLAAQQADAIAEHLAARAGAPVEPSPFRPILRGRLVTGATAEYLERALGGETDSGLAVSLDLWDSATKVDARYLSAWLGAPGEAAAREPQPSDPDLAAPAAPEVPVEVVLPTPSELRASHLAFDPYSPLTR